MTNRQLALCLALTAFKGEGGVSSSDTLFILRLAQHFEYWLNGENIHVDVPAMQRYVNE